MSNTGFTPFSEKQLTALTWWHPDSIYHDYDGIICDGAVRSGKTTCMSISFVAWAFYYFDDTSFALCGKTIASLKRNIVTSLLVQLKDLGFSCKEKLSNMLSISQETIDITDATIKTTATNSVKNLLSFIFLSLDIKYLEPYMVILSQTLEFVNTLC